MNRKLAFILLMSLLVFSSHWSQAFADTVSFDQLAVSGDLSATKYNTDMNRIYEKVNYNIMGQNIKNDDVYEAEMADDANPRVRTYEGASCQLVYSGLLPATAAALTTNTSAGVAYPMGYRISKSSATAHTYTAQRWTWVDLDQNGNFQYTEVSIGGVTPAVAANSIRLARVSSDTTTINTVTDLRTTSCTSGPFSGIADATGEATLGDIFTYGNSGWANGLNLVSVDATTFTIQPGAARINGEYRRLDSALTVDSAVTAVPLQGTSGIDAGALAANTTYYVYGVADLDATKPLTGIMSTSSSAPAGATNYRRLGEIATRHSSASMVSADPVSISYLGKIRQIKKVQSGDFFYGTTAFPNLPDDTVPQNTEGNEYMTITIVPTSVNNTLKIEAIINGASNAGGTIGVALFKDSDAGALAFGGIYNTVADLNMRTSVVHYMKAGTTSAITIKARVGSAGNTSVNGSNGARIYGGVYPSSLTVTEFEQ